MKRDIFRLLLSAVLMMCCTVMTWALETPPNDEIWYTSSDANVIAPSDPDAFGVTIQSNTYNGGKGVIKFNGQVTKIGDFAFQKRTTLLSLTMPTTVKSIGIFAFSECSNLEEIEIPNSVTSIGEYAFNGCTGLTSVSVTSGSIGSNAFAGCANLSTVILQDETIGSGVISIGDDAFRLCGNLKEITIPSTVKSMGAYVFSGTNLNDVTIGDGAYIGNYAFRYYSGKLTINGSLSGVGEYAFNGCTVLPSTISVTGTIEEYAFAGCTGLTSVSVTSGSIGSDAFAGCTNLSTVILQDETIGSGVISIGDYAFRLCGNLKEIKIPSTVKSMGAFVFSGTNLDDVTIGDGAYIGDHAFESYSGKLTINGSLSGVGESAFNRCTVLPSTISVTGTIAEYAFAECTGLTSVSVTSGSIGSNAFAGCTNLSTVILQDETTGSGVISIGDYAFRLCGNLKEITIPSTVKSMGAFVFSETNLDDVTIGDGAYIGEHAFESYSGKLTINGSLSGVGEYAFNGCTTLTSVTIESGVVGMNAFENCANLSMVTLLEGVTGIENYAFAGCTGLTSVSVTSGSIGNNAFAGCTNLSTVILQDETIGSGVISIGDYAFRLCGNLKEIKIPSTVKSMGGYVFSETNLNDVTIGDGAYIGKYAFRYYSGKLTINGSLSGVGESAFNGCTGLTSVSVTSGSIGIDAFAGCANLSMVTLLEGVTGIGNYAFENCTGLKDIFVKWTEAEKIPSIESSVFNNIDLAKVTLHVPFYTSALYNAKDVWKDFIIYEDVNFIITKTDDTTIGQKVVENGSVTIDESEDDIKSLVVSENASNVSMTYIRNFVNANKWQGWYVPFDVPVADMAAAGLDVAKIYGILLDNSGNTVVAFLKMNEGIVKANTPYVVRPNQSGEKTVTTTTKLYPTAATQFAINSAEDTYTIGGIYEHTTTPGNWYAINKDGQFQKMNTDVSLRPFRIWMTIDPRIDNPYEQSASANATMDIMVIGDGEPTGIKESLTPTLSEGKGVIYNLQGQKVTSIQRGHVYIKNGKKYVQN